jgi:hypothetical protein
MDKAALYLLRQFNLGDNPKVCKALVDKEIFSLSQLGTREAFDALQSCGVKLGIIMRFQRSALNVVEVQHACENFEVKSALALTHSLTHPPWLDFVIECQRKA